MNGRDDAGNYQTDVRELLPWYINRTLDASEHAQVAAAVNSDVTCRADYELWKKVGEFVGTDTAAADDCELDLAYLMARIDKYEATQREQFAVPAVPQVMVKRNLFATMVAYAVIVLAVVIAPVPTDISYQTRTSAQPTPAGAVRLVFDATLSAAERDALVAAAGLRLLGEPTATGVYTARAQVGQRDIEQRVAALRAAPGVKFAERIPAVQ
ncbi:MAG: hypothetical protein H6978_04525 [Gammaproteobacteria bacterium]|nr:hypothetical protein [Gammaproteobacteria bacterium]